MIDYNQFEAKRGFKNILHGKRSDQTKLSNTVTFNRYQITIFNDSTLLDVVV